MPSMPACGELLLRAKSRPAPRPRSWLAAERLALGLIAGGDGLVFCNGLGRPIEPQNLLYRSFRSVLKKAGLPPMRFHDLRHSAASLLLSMGAHPKVVQELLGHSQISVTLDTYSQCFQGYSARQWTDSVRCLRPSANPNR